jgi:hypothetical protein
MDLLHKCFPAIVIRPLLVAGMSLVLGATAMPSSAGPHVGDQRSASEETTLKQFLQSRNDGDVTHYVHVLRDLDGDGVHEAIVYLKDAPSCTDVGCVTLILKQDGGSWRMVARIFATHPPIRVLARTSNGWHDLGVHVEWAGSPGFEANLSFNGKSYPRNPSAPPARRALDELPEGEVVIPAS